MHDCWLWLYRGAWYEWELHEIDMAVPLSPNEVYWKETLFFTIRDRVMYQGNDSREFWVRAEDRNKHTARLYDELGLPVWSYWGF
jgi:glucosamine-6-phosphate deaminase